jgi:tRNA(Ile)-lysidine synthetase-like protein
VLAISGGPDSRALLESVALWPKRKNNKIIVAYVDHGARKFSSKEGDYIRLRAKRLGFDAFSISLLKLDTLSGEQDFRIARYRELTAAAFEFGCRTVCTAHHADDDAEGYFMALLGTGGGELGAAMREVYDIDNVRICRPFLSLRKQELLLAVSFIDQTDYVVDELDQACKGKRALVRNKILPKLAQNCPTIKQRLSDFARHQGTQAKLIDNLAFSLISWDKDEAFIRIDPLPHQSLLQASLWHVLKKWCQSSDIRSSGPTVDAIVEEVCGISDPRLDLNINEFSVRSPSVKQYHFPGVLVLKNGSSIVIRRV